MPTRREFLALSGAVLGGLIIPDVVRSATNNVGKQHAAHSPGIVNILMRSDPTGANVWFDPVGILILPGQTVRWTVKDNVHTTTAYHPRNSSHSLRIPEKATPWDSGYLVNPGDSFDVTFLVEGVYDYYCTPHEMAGMVGRIIVGKPVGPGTLAYDYFKGKPGTSDWKPVPEAAQKEFPSVQRIMREKIVRRR
jgi:plastocyanin